MGVGNWSWRPASGISTLVVHVDDLPETFEQYRDRAQAAWVEHARANLSSLIEEDEVPDFAWALDRLGEADIEDAIGDEFPYWSSAENYAFNIGNERFYDLVGGLQGQLQGLSMHTPERPVHLKHADDALAVAQGRFVDVVAKSWQTQIYLAVGPSAKLEDQGALSFNPAVERFVAMHLSVCAPQKNSFYDLSASHDFGFDMSPRILSLLRDGRKFSAASELLDSTVDLARSLEASGSDADCEAFEKRFGMEPSEVTMQSTANEIDLLFNYAEAIGELPSTVAEAYRTEYAAARDAVMEYLALSGEDVYEPTTGWTSKRCDLSEHREVALIDLNVGQLGVLRLGPVGYSIHQVTPYLGMEQVAFVRHSSLPELHERIRSAYPHVDAPSEGLPAIYSAGAGHGGVAVVDAGYLDTFRHRSPSKIAHDGAGFRADELPVWLKPVSDPKGLRELALSVASLPGVDLRLKKSSGDLAVTGMLVLEAKGGVQSMYVTDDPVPSDRSTYRPVVIHGQPAMGFEREARLARDSVGNAPSLGR